MGMWFKWWNQYLITQAQNSESDITLSLQWKQMHLASTPEMSQKLFWRFSTSMDQSKL